jgi:4-hydroxy-tetrahydrodipicolinate synthase
MRYALPEARDWVRATLRGYFTALYTPFTPDNQLDEAGLRHNVDATLALPGVGGLSVNTLHQEFWALTQAERLRLVEVVLEQVRGRVPVVVGCSDPAPDNVLMYAQHARAHGADLVMVWPPYYGPRSAAGVRHFYEWLAPRVGIGMVIYSTTLAELGFYLTPDQAEALLPLREICALQSTTLNFASHAAMLERVGAEIAVATSLEEYHLFGRLSFPERAPEFLIGSSRPIFCQSAAQPHCGRFRAAVEAGDFAEAARQVRVISAIAEKLQSRYFGAGFHHVALFKSLAGLLGMRTGPFRPALAPPDPRELSECAEVLVQAGLLSSYSPANNSVLR